ncbi:hypothetical protein H0H93_005648, partial [Arthromyces matolae]
MVKTKIYPEGTGWKGLCHLKERQEEDLPLDERYIRSVIEISSDDHLDDEEDEILPPEESGKPLRIVVCMTKAASFRLLEAQYLQCDTSFKRVLGFQEFELA